MNPGLLDVLVVDDNADSAEALATLLSLDGHSVKFALNADEALQLADECQPLCALIDLVLPGLSGQALAVRLRERFGHDIVLIAISGLAPSDAGIDSDYEVFDHYLPKPLSEKALQLILPPVDKRDPIAA